MSVTYAIAEREYVIHDRPLETLPIRRLRTEGGDVLSVQELLNLALGITDATAILHEYGAQFLTTLHTVEEIEEVLHIDRVQASRLLAMLALGKRLYAPNQSSLVQVRGIEDVYNHYRMLASLPKEQLWALLINSRYQVVHEEVLAIGGTESLRIVAKDVFQSAVERRTSAVVLLHNHPSGDPTPSSTDYEFTAKMQEAAQLLGIELLDHVIIAQGGYRSCMHQVTE